MRGQLSSLTALAAHNQLLVIECEIHRAKLGRAWQSLRAKVGGLTGEVRAVAALAAESVAFLIAGAQLGRMVFRPSAGKSSWIKPLINGARAEVSVWLALRRVSVDR